MKHLTMPRRTVACGSSLLLLGVICIALPRARAQSPADGQASGAGINSTPGTSVLPSPVDQIGNMGGVKAGQQASIDKMFLKKAIQENLAAVALGELTLQKSSNDQVKQFARKMIDDHTKMNEQMRPVAQQLGVDIPTEASKKDKSKIGKMQGLSGPAYDQAYIKDVVKDHKQDSNEFRLEVSNALNVGLKNVALQGGKTIDDHLQMAEQLAKDQNVDLAKK